MMELLGYKSVQQIRSWQQQWEQRDSMERELDSFKKLEELQMMKMMRDMQINIASLAAGLSGFRKEMDEMNQKVDIISKQKGTMHQAEGDLCRFGEPRGHPAQWGRHLGDLCRFGKGSYNDPMETLSKLKQTGSLVEYKTQFEVLASRVLRLIDSHKLSMFLGGLRDDIRGPVIMFNPKTLNAAYALARMQEECIVINKYGKPVWGSFRNREVGKEEDRVQKWGKTVTLAYHGQQVGRHQEEIKSPSNEKVEIQEKFKKGTEKCDQTNQEIKKTDKLEQEKEETKNKMMQETNPGEDTHHLFDQMIQPNQKELSLSKSIEVKVIPNSICSTNFLKKFCPSTTKVLKKFQHNGKIYHDEDYVFDKMLESKIVLMRDMCWDYEWGLFKIGWKQKTVQQAEIESWSSFVFQYSKADDVHVVFLKHR
jgi:hypothetical protein